MRLFLAFPISDYLSFRLLSLAKDVPDARWHTEEQLHLTVLFLGDVAEDIAVNLDQKISHLSLPKLDLKVKGVGLLGRFGRPSLHAVIQPNQDLVDLRSKLMGYARQLGIQLAPERFVPHITLANLPVDFNREKTHEWLNAYQDVALDLPTEVLNLYESIPTKNRAAYDVRANYLIDKR